MPRYWLQNVRCFVYKLKGGRDGSSMCNAMIRESLSASIQFLQEKEMAGYMSDFAWPFDFPWELPSQPHCLLALTAGVWLGNHEPLICSKRVAQATTETPRTRQLFIFRFDIISASIKHKPESVIALTLYSWGHLFQKYIYEQVHEFFKADEYWVATRCFTIRTLCLEYVACTFPSCPPAYILPPHLRLVDVVPFCIGSLIKRLILTLALWMWYSFKPRRRELIWILRASDSTIEVSRLLRMKHTFQNQCHSRGVARLTTGDPTSLHRMGETGF